MINFLKTLKESFSDANLGESKRAKVQSYLGRLPMMAPQKLEWQGRTLHVKRANKYLSYMERRIINHRRNFKSDQAVVLWAILFKNSISYQLALFHRSNPNWYWNMSSESAVKLFKSCVNKARKWDLALDIERFYIEKSNGKLRPIGAPTPVSSFISKGINDLIYFICEPNMKRYQHGFRRGRSTHTAIMEVWERIYIDRCKNIYEFDFKAFFNNVDWKFVARVLGKRSGLLADIVIDVLSGITYHHKNGMLALNPEEELKARVLDTVPKRIIVYRKGLPQGLSMSPILATLAIDLTSPPEGLTMYADDGLIINDLPKNTAIQKVNWWQAEVAQLGVRIAPEKSRWVQNEFKFLGVKFYPKENKIAWEDKEFKWEKGEDLEEVKKKLETWIKIVPEMYGKKSEGFFWDVKKNAIIEKYRNEQFWTEALTTVYLGLRKGWMHRGYKYFFARGIYNISASSTWCCNDLLALAKGIRARKIKRLNLGVPSDLFTDSLMLARSRNYEWGKEELWNEIEKSFYDPNKVENFRPSQNSKWDWGRESKQFEQEQKFMDPRKKLTKKDRYLEWALITNSTERKVFKLRRNSI